MGNPWEIPETVTPQKMSPEETFEFEKKRALEKAEEIKAEAFKDFEDNPERLKRALDREKEIKKLNL